MNTSWVLPMQSLHPIGLGFAGREVGKQAGEQGSAGAYVGRVPSVNVRTFSGPSLDDTSIGVHGLLPARGPEGELNWPQFTEPILGLSL